MARRTLLSIGTNMGDRLANIDRSLELLDSRLGSSHIRLSPVIETEAIGFDGADFLNCIAEYETDMDPYDILSICKSVESDMGRVEQIEYDGEGRRIFHDRPIDIDILTCGDIEIHTEKLTIPHPQVENRPFIKELLLLL